MSLKEFRKLESSPRILGLTASPINTKDSIPAEDMKTLQKVVQAQIWVHDGIEKKRERKIDFEEIFYVQQDQPLPSKYSLTDLLAGINLKKKDILIKSQRSVYKELGESAFLHHVKIAWPKMFGQKIEVSATFLYSMTPQRIFFLMLFF